MVGKQKKYCSKKCQYKYCDESVITRFCLNCGEELKGKQKRYCSRKCDKEYNKENKKEYRKNYYKKNKKEMRQKNKEYILKNKDRIDKYHKDYNTINSKKNARYQKEYRKSKGDILLEEKKVYYKKNKQAILKQKAGYKRKRRKIDPIFRLNNNLSACIRHSLKSRNLSKNGRHWEDLVGYTVQDLKDHLEKLFQPGMTWDNYKDWQIDHVVPRSFFKYESLEEAEFKYCWSLDNLQPLWKKDNFKKSDKMILWGKEINAKTFK